MMIGTGLLYAVYWQILNINSLALAGVKFNPRSALEMLRKAVVVDLT